MSHLWCFGKVLNLCGYVFYLGYVVKKISKPFWRTRILLIDVHPAKTRKRNYWCFYKDVAPLVLWKGFKFVRLCFLCGLCGYKNTSTVLANPHSPNWRSFGQNPETKLPLFLQRCRTSGAMEGLWICVAMFSMWAMWLKKISKPFWRTRILSIDVHSAKTWKQNHWCSYKDVAPLVLWKRQIYVAMFSMWAMWL